MCCSSTTSTRRKPGPGELKIRVTSVTLNFNDLDGIHGRYKTVPRPVPYIPGMEVLGIVEAAGPGAEWWIGRRVVAIPSGAFGGYAEYVVAPGEHGVRDADRHARVRSGRDLHAVPPRVARALRARPAAAGRDAARARGRGRCGLGRDPARRARRRARVRDRGIGREAPSCASSSAPRSRSTTARTTSWMRCSTRPTAAASTSRSTR